MLSSKSVFFSIIGVSMAVAAALQFVVVFEINDNCDSAEINLTTAPLVAGGTIAGSFLANGAWLYTIKKGSRGKQKAALFVWTVAVVIGLVAGGAALGQTLVYPTLCDKLSDGPNYTTLEYVSLGLLLFSVATPHALAKSVTDQSNEEDESSEGAPLIKPSQLKKDASPLQFL